MFSISTTVFEFIRVIKTHTHTHIRKEISNKRRNWIVICNGEGKVFQVLSRNKQSESKEQGKLYLLPSSSIYSFKLFSSGFLCVLF